MDEDFFWKRECGAILDKHNNLISFFKGKSFHVDFPEETILKIHTANPNVISRLVHTHPPGMVDLSKTDERMMRSWAHAIYPFPIRLSTLTQMDCLFVETIYVGILEPIELWKRHEEKRSFGIYKESIREIDYSKKLYEDSSLSCWECLLIKNSYVSKFIQ